MGFFFIFFFRNTFFERFCFDTSIILYSHILDEFAFLQVLLKNYILSYILPVQTTRKRMN